MTFANSQINTTDLPSLNEVEFQKLAPAFRQVEYIGMGILSLFLLAIPVVLYFNVPTTFGIFRYGGFAAWLLFFLGGMYMAYKQYELAGYALREHDVIYKNGVWWRSITTIPFNRMQHCEISQGPVQRMFGLASLSVYTAGGTSSDLSIDGLEKKEAERIKEFITGKINSNVNKNTELNPNIESELNPNIETELNDNIETKKTPPPFPSSYDESFNLNDPPQ